MHILIPITLSVLLASSPASSEWGWYRGDISTFPASNTSAGISESIHQAVGAGLDWVVLSTPPGTGSFVGQNDIVEEIKLTLPRLTPILATGWQDARTSARVLGVDSRAPIPDTLADLFSTVTSHKGLAIVSSEASLPYNSSITTFSPIFEGRWSASIGVGEAWDQALTSGRRVFIAATSSTPLANTHQTIVWSEGNHADQIIEALRKGSSFVSDTDGIHLDFQVDGHTFGRTVFHEGEPFVRIRAHARHPISSVSLIADGAEVWFAHPNSTVWEERFFLPAADYTYVRPVLYSQEGGYRTVGNPVFLITDQAAEGELPLVDARGSDPQEDLIEIGGMIEALAGLSLQAQGRILREFLSTPSTRYGTCWLLQNRSDVIGDRLLADIAEVGTDVEARLGAAYALVTRGSSLAPDLLLGFLNSPEQKLQRYASRIFAHYTEGFTESDWPWDPERDPLTSAYLIRAYRPTRFASEDVDRILSVLPSQNPALSDAASDKLVELGTRHYKVIEALLDSTESGQARAADILGIISDHRTVSRLQRIFSKSDQADLRRAVFLALAGMGAPYPDRRRLEITPLARSPFRDGVIGIDEWEGATVLESFQSDHDGESAVATPQVLAGMSSDSIYIAITRPLLSGPPTSTLSDAVESISTDDLVEIVFAALGRDGTSGSELARTTVNAFGILNQTGSVPFRAASHVTQTSWKIELSAPAVSVSGHSRFNVSMISGSGAGSRLAWSVTYGAPADPSRFGDLYSEPAP